VIPVDETSLISKLLGRSIAMSKRAKLKREPTLAVESAQPGPRGQSAKAHSPRADSPTTLNEIRVLAYRKWETAGKPLGDGTQFWLEAEKELLKRE
jgi:Protein of unknown function (DUF2934)